MTYKRTFICNVGFCMNFIHIKEEMTFKLSKATCFSSKKGKNSVSNPKLLDIRRSDDSCG